MSEYSTAPIFSPKTEERVRELAREEIKVALSPPRLPAAEAPENGDPGPALHVLDNLLRVLTEEQRPDELGVLDTLIRLRDQACLADDQIHERNTLAMMLGPYATDEEKAGPSAVPILRRLLSEFRGAGPEAWRGVLEDLLSRRPDVLSTYGGGYRDSDDRRVAFRHGIETVFNWIIGLLQTGRDQAAPSLPWPGPRAALRTAPEEGDELRRPCDHEFHEDGLEGVCPLCKRDGPVAPFGYFSTPSPTLAPEEHVAPNTASFEGVKP